MLKIEINCKRGIHSVQASGDMEDVALDLCTAINALYTQIKRSNDIAALAFKKAIMVTCGDADSPVWSREAPGGGIVIVVPNKKDNG